ncbi:MAG: hypothetical protein N3A38_14495, partial [Planctomycetota bacterium]|nr:hypothetical protein [Planctomycetota bacterium]
DKAGQAASAPTLEERRAAAARKVLAERAEGKAAAERMRAAEAENTAGAEDPYALHKYILWFLTGALLAAAAVVGVLQYRMAIARVLRRRAARPDPLEMLRQQQAERTRTRMMRITGERPEDAPAARPAGTEATRRTQKMRAVGAEDSEEPLARLKREHEERMRTEKMKAIDPDAKRDRRERTKSGRLV